MLSPFAFPLRTALSIAKGLRVDSAKHLPLAIENKKQILRFAQNDSEGPRMTRLQGSPRPRYDPIYFAYTPRAAAGSSVPLTMVRPSGKIVSS